MRLCIAVWCCVCLDDQITSNCTVPSSVSGLRSMCGTISAHLHPIVHTVVQLIIEAPVKLLLPTRSVGTRRCLQRLL